MTFPGSHACVTLHGATFPHDRVLSGHIAGQGRHKDEISSCNRSVCH